jgi:hypothetical protein
MTKTGKIKLAPIPGLLLVFGGLSLLFLISGCTESPEPVPEDPGPDSLPVTEFIDTTAGAIIDLGTVTGPVTYRASGFLWSLSYDEPHDSLLLPLKPQLFRARVSPWAKNTGLGSVMRMEEHVPRIQLVLSGDYNLRFPPPETSEEQIGFHRITHWPGDDGDFSLWDDLIEDTYELMAIKGIAVEWDIWEEPNWYGWWKRDRDQFFQTWAYAVRKLKGLDPDAVIVGPSLNQFLQEWLEDFLIFARDSNVLPDVLCWHEIHNWHSPTEIPEHIRIMKEFMNQNGIDIPEFDINEVIAPKHQTNPGMHVWYLANMEEAGIYGACKATWDDEGGEPYNAMVPTLGGFLTWPDLKPRSTWWVMKAYADISGDLMEVIPDSTMEAIAGIDPKAGTIRILLGRSSYGSSDDVVKIRNLDKVSWLAGIDSVHVVASRIPNSGWDALPAPIRVFDRYEVIRQDVLRLNFPEFGHNEALFIEIRSSDG